MKILGITIEKGKGPIISKLHTIQLIEANLQLLIRFYLDPISKKNIKKSKNFQSKLQLLEKLFYQISNPREIVNF